MVCVRCGGVGSGEGRVSRTALEDDLVAHRYLELIVVEVIVEALLVVHVVGDDISSCQCDGRNLPFRGVYGVV